MSENEGSYGYSIENVNDRYDDDLRWIDKLWVCRVYEMHPNRRILATRRFYFKFSCHRWAKSHVKKIRNKRDVPTVEWFDV